MAGMEVFGMRIVIDWDRVWGELDAYRKAHGESAPVPRTPERSVIRDEVERQVSKVTSGIAHKVKVSIAEKVADVEYEAGEIADGEYRA
jgi:hypothetical protein